MQVPELGKTVEVYFNLHRKLWSVRDKKSGRVILHCDRVELENVTFHVSAAGNAKVRREKKKNVHATVRGTLLSWSGGNVTPFGDTTDVIEYYTAVRHRLQHKFGHQTAYYNPYICTTFEYNDRPIHETDYTILKNKIVYIADKKQPTTRQITPEESGRSGFPPLKIVINTI